MTFLRTYFPVQRDASGRPSLRLTIHHAIYLLLLTVLIGSQSVSKFMMSGMEILLAANWLLEWDMRRKFARCGRGVVRPLLAAFLVLMVVHVVWMVPTQNAAYGWDDIFKKLPLLAIPLVVLTSRPLNRKQLSWLFLFFTATVFVATIIGRVRIATIDNLPYRQIIPFISHIRFALNVCLAIVIAGWFLVVRHRRRRGSPRRVDWLSLLVVAVVLSLVDFLFRIRSYTAFIVLIVTAIVLLVVFWRKIGGRRLRIAAAVSLGAVLAAVAIVTCVMVRSYYTPVELARQPLAATTVNGNAYKHLQDGMMENGNYVNNYICDEELTREWQKRSDVPLDHVVNGEYTVYPTLIRYLNALGTTKDSVGMLMLSAADIDAIEHGEANPVYVYGSTLRKMYYVMLYEYESYRVYGAVRNFTMLERFELWKNAWRVFCQHPLFGVGTGDVVDACHAQLESDASPLAGTVKHAHNQYLTFLVAFGLVGLLVIVAAFVVALRKERLMRLPAMAAFVCILLISFITEDTVETLAGCVFACLYPCLMAVWSDGEEEECEEGC